MSKKNFVSQKQKATIEEIVAWKTPTFHQASECYIAVSAFDPTIGKLHTKKFMLGRIKGSVLKPSCKPILLSTQFHKPI